MKLRTLLIGAAALFLAGLCAFFFTGLVLAIKCKGLASSEAAGWVQAIGATLGLAIAIWVPLKQKSDTLTAAKDAQRDMERRVCLAFHDELSLLASRFEGANVRELLRDAPGEIFDREIPVPRQRFPVFDSMIGRLTEVSDERIRHGLIEAYEHANSLIDLATWNNRHLLEFADMIHKPTFEDGANFPSSVRQKEEILVNIRTQMHLVCRETISKVRQVLPLLSAKGPNSER